MQKGVRTLREDGMVGRVQFPGAGELICRELGTKHERLN